MPAKYFSIDRVFRNETLDATHLAEFHQIEGLVVDFGLTLGNLMGVLHQFFTKLGLCFDRFFGSFVELCIMSVFMVKCQRCSFFGAFLIIFQSAGYLKKKKHFTT